MISDHGNVMQRRLLERQIKLVAEGGDPLRATFDAAQALVKIRSGNLFRKTETAE